MKRTMKPEARVIGWDDSPHTRADGRVPVVGVRMRGGGYVDGLLATDVARDGDDATNRVARCVAESGARGVKALLLDGASFGGFNMVDLDALFAETRIPCLAVTKGVPDVEAMRRALDNVPNPDGKRAILAKRRPERIGPLTVSFAGMDREQAAALLAHTTVRGDVPEPLRLAHLIAGVMR